jgi:hypothetical protein
MTDGAQPKTAFVFAGGGSFGAIQVGMLHSLATHGIAADMVFGSSAGALNAAYYAGNPTLEGVRGLEAIWRGLRRQEVFPLTLKTLYGFVRRRDFLVTSGGLRGIIDTHLPYRNLEDAKIPITWSRPTSCRARPSCCRKVRPPTRSWPAPRSRRLSRRCGSKTFISPTAPSAAIPRSALPRARRQAPHHPADRICLRAAAAADRRGWRMRCTR